MRDRVLSICPQLQIGKGSIKLCGGVSMKMHRVSVHLAPAVLACVAIASFTSVVRAAGEPVGKVASVQNQVETKASGAGDWTAAILQQSLHELDRMRTGP